MSALAPQPQYPSFKFTTPGTTAHGIIICPPEDRQAQEFGTGKPKFWPDGKPLIQTRVVLRDNTGAEYAIYASGRMARAITKAIVAAGAPDLLVGGELSVTFTETVPSKGGGQPAKEYEARYVSPAPPAAGSADDDEPPF
jgi:hypothetical protein